MSAGQAPQPAPSAQPPPALTRIVFCVEASAAMAAGWAFDRASYIEPLLRAVDAGRLGPCQLACVFFATRSAFR